MRIGVPTEIKSNEFRVGMMPGSVREFVARGHEVIVRRAPAPASSPTTPSTSGRRTHRPGRRGGVRRSRHDRQGEGAAADRVAAAAAQPDPLHLSAPGSRSRAGRGLMASGATAIAYETVTDSNGALPLLAPMSEVAGRLSIEACGDRLAEADGGRGVLLGGVPGVPPAKVVVLGGGVVGTHAARRPRARRRSLHPRPLAAASAPARRAVRWPRTHALLHARDDRGGGVRRRCRGGCRARRRRQRAQARDPRDAEADEARRRARRRRRSTRAAASRRRSRRRTLSRPSRSTGSSITASPTCQAASRCPRPRR